MVVDLLVGPDLPNGLTLVFTQTNDRTSYAERTSPLPAPVALRPGLNRGVPADCWDMFRTHAAPEMLARFIEVARY